MSASVATYTSRRRRHANSASMRALRAEPEAEHDRDVREERERVPVIDRLVEARDALVLRDRARHGLRDESPHQRRTDDDGEHRPRQTGRLRTACRREHEPESEEHGVRDALVERVPAAIADDRPPDGHAGPGHEEDERPDEHRSRAAQSGAREAARTQRQRAHRRAGGGRPRRPAASRRHRIRRRRTSRPAAPRRRGRRERQRQSRTRARTAPTPSPWRATLAACPRFSRRPAGYAGSLSNNSFTLPTPPAHRAPEDSAQPGLRSFPVRTHL